MWQWWKKRKENQELRQRFRDAFGFRLALPGEDGRDACTRRVNEILANYRWYLEEARAHARQLNVRYGQTRDGLVWAEVEAARMQADRLAESAMAIERLAREAGIQVFEPISTVGEEAPTVS
ncbi:hypothetical protein HY624_02200 [Candidatus Uhrbacteria bacterium]|nr:hypothetical protein [Candidatus Uhrbacteria bacterium]